MKVYKSILISLIAFPLFLPISLFAQDLKEKVIIQKIKGSIDFDGRPDENAWKALTPFDLVMYQPVHGSSPSEDCDIRIGFDDNFLYVGACLFYKDISLITATGKKRDYAQPTCDWLGIHLDTYNDNQNSMIFYTNPNGLRFDATAKRDMQSFEQDINFNWNTYWETKTQIDDKGWYAEMKIPLSSLRYQVHDGNVEMGLTISRFIPAKNEMCYYPLISLDYNMGPWKPSLADNVVFMGIESRRPLYLSPYILAGYGRNAELNETESGYKIISSPEFEAGLDFKMGITDNITMDITVNTDFAQVEADDQQINLSRYSLFFPEKRVFFQEKADAFDFSMGGPNNLFYSRRIGLHEGESVRLLGGFRLTGRAGNWDIGALNMQTARISELPSENFSAARFKRTAFNEYSYMGGMVTSRIGLDGSYNINTGFDASIRMFGDEYLAWQLVRTFDNDIGPESGSFDPVRSSIAWERRRDEGLGYDLSFFYSGKDFDPAMGFLWREAYYGIYSKIQYGWLGNESSKLLRHGIQFSYIQHNSLITESLESLDLNAGWKFESKGGLTGNFVLNHENQALVDTLEICDDVCIAPGNYKYNYLSTEFMLPPTLPVVAMIKTETGSFYDGWKTSLTLMPTWSASASFDLSGTIRIDYINIKTRDISFLNHIIGVKGLWTFTTKTSLGAFIQYNTAVDDVIANIRFRYNPREGVDFYLVYNEGLNSDPYSQVPKLPVSDSRTFMAKFTYTIGR